MELSAEVKAIIEEEERILAGVIDSLRAQMTHGRSRLAVESERAREFTSRIVASHRDTDKQMLASDEAVAHGLSKMKRQELTDIEKLLNRPYFARIVLEEENKGRPQFIEYKIGSVANIDCRIIDWKKAPIAKLYYELKEGEEYAEEIQGREREGKVLIRRRVEIDGGVLNRLHCHLGDFEKVDGVWQEASGKRRRGSRDGLPDVLSLITSEQYRAITEEASTAVLIQGVAGSGKTTVALYRLAWLFNHPGSTLQRSDSAIVVKSPALKSYIERSLPSLELSALTVKTFNDWIEPTVSAILGEQAQERMEPETSLSIARLKRSLGIVMSLEDYVRGQEKRLEQYLEQDVFKPELPAEVLTRARTLLAQQRDSKTHLPVLVLAKRFIAFFEEELAQQKESASLAAALESVQTAERRLKLYREDLVRIFSRPDPILKHDETKLLSRELITEAHRAMEAYFREGRRTVYDDVLLARLAQLKNGGLFRRTEIGLSLAPRLKQLTVDEVQDLSPVELAIVVGAVENVSQLTLVGDTAQEISHERTFPGWDKLRSHWGLGNELSQFVTLSVSHRSTVQIMRLAEHVAGLRRSTGGREGALPSWYPCRREIGAVTESISWLKKITEETPDSIVAVVCRDAREARYVHSLLEPTFGGAVRIGDQYSFTFDTGVIVTDVEQVKGLEFESVFIWNPSLKSYGDNPLDRSLLYVAITRAEENLAFATHGKPSVLLPPRSLRLVRVVEEEPEEEEAPQSTNAFGWEER